MVIILRFKKNKIELEKEKEMTPYERQKDYTRRTILLKDFAKEIKTTNIFVVVKRRFKDAIDKNIKLLHEYGIKVAILEIISDIFGEVVPVAGGFGYGCYRLVVLKNLPISQFSVLISAITTCRNKLNNLAFYFARQQKHCLWVQNLRDFLEYEPKLKGGEIEPEDFESLEFKNVSFRYDGQDEYTLKNISFKINKGETFAVVGHNGAGKTTLSKLIMRLYDVTEGEILYNGINIKEYKLAEYRNKFASVFQDYMIFAMTVAENVLFEEVNDENRERAKKALEMSGAYAKISSLPEELNTLLTREFDDEGAVLSVGEAQKVSLARAFTNDSPFVILDEPSSALDPIAEYNMFKNMLDACRDRTLIFISHRLSSAVLADRIFLMDGGEIIESGSHDEMMAKNGKYAEMFRMQAENYAESESEVNPNG